MMGKRKNEYRPDYVSPPGETLLELITSLDITQAELAKRMGRHIKTVNEIIKGKAPITPGTAIQLEKVLGPPASFWNNREKQYREFLAQEQEQENLEKQLDFLREIPAAEMVKSGWIKKRSSKPEQLAEVLKFFGAAGVEQVERLWQEKFFAFRKSKAFAGQKWATYAWLKQGEIEARQIHCEPFDKKRFKEVLESIRNLTDEAPGVFVPEMQALCASAGAAAVFVPVIKGVTASGVTRWLSPSKALIQLSLRYKRNDHLWFTFFHEAGHILLHGKKMLFIEDHNESDEFEKEADRFAADFLIPGKRYGYFVQAGVFTRESITGFARQIGIAPGVVLGRLQHEGHVPFSHFFDLFVKLDWSK